MDMTLNLIRLLLGVTLTCVPVTTAYTLQDIQDVHTLLFTTNAYNKNIRPVIDQSDVMNVTVTFYLSSIIDFNEQEESLAISGFLSLAWEDEALVWNQTTYGGVTHINIPQGDIWTPDISLRNSYTSFKELGNSNLNAWIFASGSVMWQPFQVLKSTCALDITKFPFDIQTCKFKFIAPSYTKEEVYLSSGVTVTPIQITSSDYAASAQWTPIASRVRWSPDDASLTFYLKLQRKPLFYVINIILPVFMLSLLNIFTFVLPAKSGERASFSVTVFLSLAVFLTIVASTLPVNSDVTSHLAGYLITMTGMSTFISLMTVFQLRILARDERECHVQPGPVYRIIYKVGDTLMHCKCLCSKCKQAGKTEVQKLPTTGVADEDGKGQLHNEDCDQLKWEWVVNAMDYILFCVTALVTLFSTIVFLVLSSNNPAWEPDQYIDLKAAAASAD